MSVLVARPLCASVFAAYGEVLAFDGAPVRTVNDGAAVRADLPVRLSGSAGRPRLALFRVEGRTLPLETWALERHPHSPQMFFPVSADAYLVVMAPPAADGGPDARRAEAFIGRRGQGVAYGPGVWHAPIVSLGAEGDFLMLIWEQDGPEDCHVVRLADPLRVHPDHC